MCIKTFKDEGDLFEQVNHKECGLYASFFTKDISMTDDGARARLGIFNVVFISVSLRGPVPR